MRQWLALPTPSTDRGNRHSSDVALLGRTVMFASKTWARTFCTTLGDKEFDVFGNKWRVHPGKLRPIDLEYPLPVLGSDDIPWAGTSTIHAEVTGWNAVLDDPATPDDIEEGKWGGLQGLIAEAGTLFVPVTHKWGRASINDPPQQTNWNGLAYLDGSGPPPLAFDVTDELWSTAAGEENVQAVPENSDIAITQAPSQPGRFFFLNNYCGSGNQGAGHLLVQDITNLSNIQVNQRVLVNLYKLLASYVNDPSTPNGVLGAEVPSCFFWTTAFSGCASPLPQHNGGNKNRPVHVFQASRDLPQGNGAKDRLIAVFGLNTDPVQLLHDGSTGYYYPATPVPMDGNTSGSDPGCAASIPGTNRGRDDGKYDYLAIIDITDMSRLGSYPLPSDPSWPFQANGPVPLPDEWKARTRFLRLPPDLPAGFTLNDPAQTIPDDVGYDWSCISVPHPTDELQSFDVGIVGSGTPSAITSDPTGRYLYLVTIDQGQEHWDEDAADHDGGWHVPHLYTIDLADVDVTDQAELNYYTPTSQRFNKLVFHDFAIPPAHGWANVPSTIPGMPTAPGTVYPGENQCDPTGRTRIFAVNNPNMATGSNPDRLYIAANGHRQEDSTTAFGWGPAGVVFTLSIDTTDGSVSWLNTIKIPRIMEDENSRSISALATIPTSWMLNPVSNPRNGLLILTQHAAPLDDIEDRLVIVQEEDS